VIDLLRNGDEGPSVANLRSTSVHTRGFLVEKPDVPGRQTMGQGPLYGVEAAETTPLRPTPSTDYRQASDPPLPPCPPPPPEGARRSAGMTAFLRGWRFPRRIGLLGGRPIVDPARAVKGSYPHRAASSRGPNPLGESRPLRSPLGRRALSHLFTRRRPRLSVCQLWRDLNPRFNLLRIALYQLSYKALEPAARRATGGSTAFAAKCHAPPGFPLRVLARASRDGESWDGGSSIPLALPDCPWLL
jgi:hypothetical protein